MKCHECNGEAFDRRVVELKTRVGEHTVINRTVRRPVCVQCGAFTIPASVLETVEQRAAIIAFTDAPRVTGAMLRFARKALDLTQAELAARLGTAFESVSRWEREERPTEPWVPVAVLGLVREKLMPLPQGIELRQSA